MPVYIFIVANIVVMHAIGHADRGGFLSLSDSTVPLQFWHVIAISGFMGLLSGSIVGIEKGLTFKMGLMFVALHTISAIAAFAIGLGTLAPYALTFGVGMIFFLCSTLVILLHHSRPPQREEEDLREGV